MTNRAIYAAKLSLIIAATTLACSTSPSTRAGELQRADVRPQEVREDTEEIPCEPRLVLQTICQRCHALPPQNGVPFPLVRRSDVLAMRAGVLVRELMIQQLEAGRMPLRPVSIELEQREVLLDWLRSGAPAVVPTQCGEAPADGGADTEIPDSATTSQTDACTGTCGDADADAGPPDDADAAPE